MFDEIVVTMVDNDEEGLLRAELWLVDERVNTELYLSQYLQAFIHEGTKENIKSYVWVKNR